MTHACLGVEQVLETVGNRHGAMPAFVTVDAHNFQIIALNHTHNHIHELLALVRSDDGHLS